jgi:hypothetical protein
MQSDSGFQDRLVRWLPHVISSHALQHIWDAATLSQEHRPDYRTLSLLVVRGL